MMSIFLSHNTADKPFVRKLARDLDNHGVKCWFDEAEIKVGESLIEKIRQGLDEVDYLAVILSPNSIASPWVQREVDVAMNRELQSKIVKVLPIMYQRCELMWSNFSGQRVSCPEKLDHIILAPVFNRFIGC